MREPPVEGVGLEARVLRSFLARGSFAESRLFPAADPNHRMLATDIDVLVSEYGSGFDLTRRHIECKGGKTSVLDRVLWLAGARSLLDAEGSHLVLKEVDYEAARFAWNLKVHLVSVRQVGEWESALGIPPDRWPCRSDFQALGVARSRWQNHYRQKEADADWRLLREMLDFLEIESWLEFRYRLLNRLLRYLDVLGERFPDMKADEDKRLCAKYCASALAVRAGQYLLAICLDVTPVPAAELKGYLTDRLTFGDRDRRDVDSVIRGTVNWVRKALEEKGSKLPPEVNVSRLFEAPRYNDEFIELIQVLLLKSDEALTLPVALEVVQFDEIGELREFPRLERAAQSGDRVGALFKAFLVRNFNVSNELLAGVGGEIRIAYGGGKRPQKPDKGAISQLPLRSATRAERESTSDEGPAQT